MNITFRDINFSADEDCEILASWFNQDVPALSLTAQGGDTAESIRREYINSSKRTDFGAFFLCVEGQPVGYASFFLDPANKLSKEKVVWPSLTIGSREHRRKGLVFKIGEEISRRAKKWGATHIEAGVFASNLPMIALLQKYGFSEIGHQIVGPAHINSIHFLRPLFE